MIIKVIIRLPDFCVCVCACVCVCVCVSFIVVFLFIQPTCSSSRKANMQMINGADSEGVH